MQKKINPKAVWGSDGREVCCQTERALKSISGCLPRGSSSGCDAHSWLARGLNPIGTRFCFNFYIVSIAIITMEVVCPVYILSFWRHIWDQIQGENVNLNASGFVIQLTFMPWYAVIKSDILSVKDAGVINHFKMFLCMYTHTFGINTFQVNNVSSNMVLPASPALGRSPGVAKDFENLWHFWNVFNVCFIYLIFIYPG